jgi:hypothetical protein
MVIRSYFSAVILLWGALLQVGVANSQIDGVQRELDGLRRHLEIQPLSDHAGKGSAVEVQIQDSGPWRKLKPEMTEEEVVVLLGKPDRVDSRSQTVRWYWDKQEPKGWVSFGFDTRRVIEWRYF